MPKKPSPRHGKNSFLLNPHEYTRLSRCPFCDKPTFPRKFPLFIQVEDAQPIVLRKTCKYCANHKLIICHQDELDAELAHAFEKLNPKVIGNPYLVIGTMDPKVWKEGMAEPLTTAEAIEHVEIFKKVYTLDLDPGGLRHKDADPEQFIIKHAVAEARRQTPWTAGRKIAPQ